jgi:hypothetical protein
LSGIARIAAPHGRRALVVLAVVLAAAGAWIWARPSAGAQLAPMAVLRVDASRPGSEFAPGAVGLSTETRELGDGRLSAGRYSLVRLMRLLGPAVLRIGGSSVDSSWWTASGEPPPSWATSTVTPAVLAVLRGLLAATGWRALLGVDLAHFEPSRAADEARYARKILGSSLIGIEIGNEPNGYGHKQVNGRPSTYDVGEYLREAEAYHQALTAAVPDMAVYGPATGAGNRWLNQMGTAAGMFTVLTEHYYPIVPCSISPSSAAASPPTPVELLSPPIREQEDRTLDALRLAGAVSGRPTLIGETGTAGCTGNASAGPLFASALWSLDWALRAASGGVRGLSFHGHFGVCGLHNQSPICAPSYQAAQAGAVTAQPEYYGLLAARQLEGGRFVPTRPIAPDPLPNLTTWATLTPGGELRIAIDDLATVGPSQPVSISVAGFAVTGEETLIAPSVSARSGIVLGAAPVTAEGGWRPRIAGPRRARRSVRVVVRPASAVIVILRRTRSQH